ncbi:hypothetical protein D9M69_651070 [compost metagenome]
MKKRRYFPHTNSGPQSPRTGENCPVTGWWAPFNDELNAQFITEGSLLPSNYGSAVSWKLIVRGLGGQENEPSQDLPPRTALDII